MGIKHSLLIVQRYLVEYKRFQQQAAKKNILENLKPETNSER
jgi:hypothetical protein